jgi:predicted restriction endonuclease
MRFWVGITDNIWFDLHASRQSVEEVNFWTYRCAMSGERTLPVLEAHIRPYSQAQDHSLSNGLLLRSDLHKLFDLSYVGVNPTTLKIEVSRKIREEFENGVNTISLMTTN